MVYISLHFSNEWRRPGFKLYLLNYNCNVIVNHQSAVLKLEDCLFLRKCMIAIALKFYFILFPNGKW